MSMDDLELWHLASRASEPARLDVVARLAADEAQRARVEALLAQPAPRAEEGPRYEIVERIGEGTQADVYRARRVDLGRDCALKVFRGAADPAFVERVRAEAALMARVLSPHVVPVFDAGDLGDGRSFLEMALCAEPDVDGGPGAVALGRSLRSHVVERGALPPDEAARLLVPVCQAVAAAHRAGVVHSDVKPENVLVLPRSGHALLADFGIAASLAAPARDAAPTRVGTLAYMAPEQFEGLAPPTPASDVYGLGGALYFALTGRAPHPGRRADGTDGGAGAWAPLPPSTPASLAEILARALARDAAARPAAHEMAAALEAFLARRPTAWDLQRPGRRAALFYQRHSILVNLAFLGIVVAATLGLGLLRTVVAKTGLEARTGELNGQVSALGADVERLRGEKGGLEDEVRRLRGEKEAVSGSEAREREERLRAEGRSADAAAHLEAAEVAARGAAADLARTREALDAAQAGVAREQARAERLERDLAATQEQTRADAARYEASVEALRQGFEARAASLDVTLAREREASAALARRLDAAERERAQAAAERAKAEARAESLRVERDDLRARVDAVTRPREVKGEAKAADGAKGAKM
jgi:Protein kinase domain